MASIVERPRKNAPSTWQVHVRVKGQPSLVKTFSLREEAELFAQEAQTLLQKESTKQAKLAKKVKPPCSVAYKDMLARDVIQRFVARPEATQMNKSLSKTIINNIGSVKIGAMTPSWIRGYIDRMRGKLTNRKTPFTYDTISKHMIVMSGALAWQADILDIEVPRLRFSTKMFPKHWENARERRLPQPEMRLLMQQLRAITTPRRQHWRYLIWLAIETAARQQELILSDWSEFDLSKRVWTIPANHTKGKKKRAIPLSRRAMRVMTLLWHYRDPEQTRVFHPMQNVHSVSSMFQRYVRRAGLQDFRFHDLRHEGVSRMIENKRELSVFEIMRIVGHSSLDMLNRYANLRADDMVARMQ
ncbi:site-specific integrase [Robbsia sp. KACC 23696]|uniref:site-specific integrase n=1 Tax=Robbsia sp. KACC 23696 TaxID=3149231 RepID=UPI00325BC2B4